MPKREPPQDRNSSSKKRQKVEEPEEEYNTSDDQGEVDEGTEDYKPGGYHPVTIRETYNDRYVILRKLGWGHFSTVWLAEDKKSSNHVALKFVKSASHYTDAARDEIQLLNAAGKHDRPDEKHIVRLLDDFEHEGPNGNHVVMVFEVLGKHLLDLIEKHHHGLDDAVIKSITKQILVGLDFLHTKPKIIHTDLKPENVLLIESFKLEGDDFSPDESQLVTQIKIADLGNACWVDKHFSDDVQTRQYRSPEVILRCSYGPSADLWSLGCMVFEMATGDLLFKPKKSSSHGKSDDHLALMMELLALESIPESMRKGKRYGKYANGTGQLQKIRDLKHWDLPNVLKDKYEFSS